MLAIVMSSLFVAAAPALEIVEDLETQEEIVISEEDAVYEDEECLEEIVFDDAESAEGVIEDAIAFDEE